MKTFHIILKTVTFCKMLQIWQMPKNDSVKIISRDVPLLQNRVASVFMQKQTAVNNDSSEDDGDTQIIEKVREVAS